MDPSSAEAKRLELHEILVGILGSRFVYFQPPPNVQMQYPCIVYERDSATTKYAGNAPYSRSKRYQVTIIDRDPDSIFPDTVALLPMSSFSRHFVADNLHHDVYSLFY